MATRERISYQTFRADTLRSRVGSDNALGIESAEHSFALRDALSIAVFLESSLAAAPGRMIFSHTAGMLSTGQRGAWVGALTTGAGKLSRAVI